MVALDYTKHVPTTVLLSSNRHPSSSTINRQVILIEVCLTQFCALYSSHTYEGSLSHEQRLRLCIIPNLRNLRSIQSAVGGVQCYAGTKSRRHRIVLLLIWCHISSPLAIAQHRAIVLCYSMIWKPSMSPGISIGAICNVDRRTTVPDLALWLLPRQYALCSKRADLNILRCTLEKT
jgi:hypothetical protein